MDELLVRGASVTQTLLFREHGYIEVLGVDILPAKSLTALIDLVAENFRSPNLRVREEIDEDTIATGFDRRLSILTDIIDSLTCLLVDELSKLSTVVGGPGLLVTALVTTIVRDGLGGIASLGDILGEMAFTNSSSTERGDVGVVGSYCARRPALTGQMPCVLAEMA